MEIREKEKEEARIDLLIGRLYSLITFYVVLPENHGIVLELFGNAMQQEAKFFTELETIYLCMETPLGLFQPQDSRLLAKQS